MKYQMRKEPHPSRGYSIGADGDGVSYMITVYQIASDGKRSSLINQNAEAEEFVSKLAEAVNSLA